MSEAKHTPGPWTAHTSSVDEYFPISAEVTPDRRGMIGAAHFEAWAHKAILSRETALANGRLIAAAPELLHAAKRALNVFKAQGESVRPGNVLSALSEAIAKAEGRV